MEYVSKCITFVPPRGQRLVEVRTPCENPGCAHVVEYGNPVCCPEFSAALGRGLREGEPPHVPGQPIARWWAPYFFWSGGTVVVPSNAVRLETDGGWHNGCHYSNSEPLFVRALAGCEPVYA